jgi:hypothetical protein
MTTKQIKELFKRTQTHFNMQSTTYHVIPKPGLSTETVKAFTTDSDLKPSDKFQKRKEIHELDRAEALRAAEAQRVKEPTPLKPIKIATLESGCPVIVEYYDRFESHLIGAEVVKIHESIATSIPALFREKILSWKGGRSVAELTHIDALILGSGLEHSSAFEIKYLDHFKVLWELGYRDKYRTVQVLPVHKFRFLKEYAERKINSGGRKTARMIMLDVMGIETIREGGEGGEGDNKSTGSVFD